MAALGAGQRPSPYGQAGTVLGSSRRAEIGRLDVSYRQRELMQATGWPEPPDRRNRRRDEDLIRPVKAFLTDRAPPPARPPPGRLLP